jgi:hypothetical protein
MTLFPAFVVTRATRILAVSAAFAMTSLFASPASAQGLFDLFGARPAAPPAQTMAYADPNSAAPKASAPAQTSAGSGRTVSYCVRLCDGRHFPIQHHAAATPVQLCNALCPAAPTKIFSGSDISRAVAKDGTRYSALENAFVYRTRVVSDCTCNGKDAFGTAPVDVSADPTLRSGDIVATETGQVAYAASKSSR